jgi:hypothetical protein
LFGGLADGGRIMEAGMGKNFTGALKRAMCGAAAAAAVVAVAPTANAEVQPSGDPALYWNQVLASGIAGSPATTTRSYAMVAVAIHEAVNATSGFPDFSYIKGVATSGGDTSVATAVAAHTLLVQLNPAKAADYNAALNSVLAAVPDGAAKSQGIATGSAIAAAVMNFRANDGSAALVSYSPTGLPGNWAPTPPGNLPAAIPQWADVTPWLMNSPDQFRPSAPPNIGTIAYAAAYNEVLAVGGVGSATRTAYQSDAANLWAAPSAGGLAPWLQNGLAVAEGAHLSTIENARLFATLATGVADATIGIFDAKYEYDFWRPVTAFAADGIAFTPFITTPNHPSYISGHAAQSMTAATILALLLGDDHQNICFSGAGVTHCFDSFTSAALEAADSRIWGGIHWGFDRDAGLALGSEVGAFAVSSRAFDAVPEPATWAMMIMGFGFAGALLRRRSRRLDFAAG